ncbi:50S ribosomal protein L18e [uncultured archaeon]|nr:50S ribosomal protein L18e [uncultured archaeon]
MKRNYKTNPQLLDLISGLKKQSREKETPLWRDIALRLERPTRIYPEVNLSRINRYTKEKDLILVPGKVLGAGELDHGLTVAALNFSGSARSKITAAGGSCLSIEELMNRNPEGARVRIMG